MPKGTKGERVGEAPSDGVSGPTAEPLELTSAASTAAGIQETVSSLADEARGRLNEVVDKQKSVGADRISDVSRAVQTAAGSLQETSPPLSRLVRGAADSLDQVADDIRAKGIGDIVDTLSNFGRRQPLAFFGGAAVIGFMLTRFLKSDAPVSSLDRPTDSPRQV